MQYNSTSSQISFINSDIQELWNFLERRPKSICLIRNLFDAQTKFVTLYLKFKEISSEDEVVNLWLKNTWVIIADLMVKLDMN